jgi:hypothetical protein
VVGLIFEKWGCFKEAVSAYESSANLGSLSAKLKLTQLANKQNLYRTNIITSKTKDCSL